MLTINLSFFPWIVAGELMQGYSIQALLANYYVGPYNFFLIAAFGIACYLIIKRAITYDVMGRPQLAIVVAAASMLALWTRFA